MVVDSDPGFGTRFQITLELPIATQPAEKPRTVTDNIAPQKGLAILLAEDNDVNRDLIVAMLSAMQSHEVTAVADGAAAVEEMKARQYDLALLDIHMPIMDGLAAIKAIRSLPGETGNIPAIALTADAIVGQDEVYRAAGFNACVTKPINWPTLISAINRFRRQPDGVSDAPIPIASPARPAL